MSERPPLDDIRRHLFMVGHCAAIGHFKVDRVYAVVIRFYEPWYQEAAAGGFQAIVTELKEYRNTV